MSYNFQRYTFLVLENDSRKMFYHSGANFKNSKKGLIPYIFNIGQLNNLSVVRNFYEYLVLIIIFREEDDELVKPITWRRAPAPVLPVLDRYKSCLFRLRQIFIRSFPSQTDIHPVLLVLDRYTSCPSLLRQLYILSFPSYTCVQYILSFPSQTVVHPVLPVLDSYISCRSRTRYAICILPFPS